MEQIYLDRLTKLADHLMNSKELGVDRFDFAVIYDEVSCGTVGCALGTLPYLCPDEWERVEFSAHLRIGSNDDAFEDATKWFDISYSEAEHLFSPFSQNTTTYGGENLNYYATQQQVAQNMYCFIEHKKGEVS